MPDQTLPIKSCTLGISRITAQVNHENIGTSTIDFQGISTFVWLSSFMVRIK
jgi:hypothetical protein